MVSRQGDGCIVNMDGVNMHGPTKRGSRLRLYQFMMVRRFILMIIQLNESIFAGGIL